MHGLHNHLDGAARLFEKRLSRRYYKIPHEAWIPALSQLAVSGSHLFTRPASPSLLLIIFPQDNEPPYCFDFNILIEEDQVTDHIETPQSPNHLCSSPEDPVSKAQYYSGNSDSEQLVNSICSNQSIYFVNPSDALEDLSYDFFGLSTRISAPGVNSGQLYDHNTNENHRALPGPTDNLTWLENQLGLGVRHCDDNDQLGQQCHDDIVPYDNGDPSTSERSTPPSSPSSESSGSSSQFAGAEDPLTPPSPDCPSVNGDAEEINAPRSSKRPRTVDKWPERWRGTYDRKIPLKECAKKKEPLTDIKRGSRKKKFTCSKCRSIFTVRRKYETHHKPCGIRPNYFCDCGQGISRLDNMKKHRTSQTHRRWERENGHPEHEPGPGPGDSETQEDEENRLELK
ncbi:hypothetical protein TWF730_007119 [Orbilia blumenaviensis]|uniref:C2H2-type domain-containing protein n=1 Tax=Orbilia blumenaviensis TaxID=1796055 RepID=A0AAV9VIU2_9PEZI